MGWKDKQKGPGQYTFNHVNSLIFYQDMFDFVEVVNSLKICIFWELSRRNSDVTKNWFSLWKRPWFVYDSFFPVEISWSSLADKKYEFKSKICHTRTFLAHLSTTCSRGAFRVVMCLSCVINNFCTHLLLPSRWASLDQTWQECSLGGPL